MKRILLVVMLALAGCQTAPDPRDPAIYRPRAPINYPTPH